MIEILRFGLDSIFFVANSDSDFPQTYKLGENTLKTIKLNLKTKRFETDT